MPAARPRASFEPTPPDFDVRTFVETADNFQYVDRISYEMIAQNGMEQFEKLVLLHVIIGGKPLVIDGFEEMLDPWVFTPSWLRDNHGDKKENARNLTQKSFMPVSVGHYLKHLGQLTEQFFAAPERYQDMTRQRVYMKDIDCPPVWQDKVMEHIPPGLFYLNDSTGEVDGPGASDERGSHKGRGIARAGDLMSSLPPDMRAENLMCYIGHEGTYTPAHREMCASLGQNIMVNTSSNIGEDGQAERPGSSLWFMTETKDREVVSEYWLSVLGHDIEVENHFAQLFAWKKAPFKTYVVEQKAGDFILIPPLAPHQVWNRGTRTMKVAWNRTTVETLEMAMSEALPNSRLVCRDEQYKNKAIIYYTLLKYSSMIKTARRQVELGGEHAEAIQRSIKVRQVQRDFKRLFDLYKIIMLSEMFTPDSREHSELTPFDSNVTCSYCRCNIFNRFLTCKSCKNAFGDEIEEPYDICMDCYCMGRSCYCQSGYTWVEQWKWKDLIHKYEEWRAQIIDIDGQITEKTPLPLQEERRYLGKKTLAQVCQEQLKSRPFVDVKHPQPENEGSDNDEIQVNDDGTLKRMVKKRSKQWLSKNKSCHFCLHRHPNWKMAFCSNCDLAYCYGTLFRAHDLMPLGVMENPSWKCPHCRRTCNTGACRRDPRQHPYEPKGTLLGHDTKKVADVRSVECLVDFSVSNLNWLREDEINGSNMGPLARRRDAAARAKLTDPSLDDRYIDENHEPHAQFVQDGIAYSPVQDSNVGFGDAIDPALDGVSSFVDPNASPQSGFVQLSAVQYQADGAQDGEFEEYSPEPDPNFKIPRFGKRHRTDDDGEDVLNGAMKAKRQRKKKKSQQDELEQPSQPKTASGKQYQKEVERKLLDEAKKEDRFIIVAARLRKKSRIVKLALGSDLLGALERRPGPARRQVVHEEPDQSAPNSSLILESDVLPRAESTPKSGHKTPVAKTFRVRVEEDETYRTRKRAPDSDAPVKPGKAKRSSQRYEEITLDSDEDPDDLVENWAVTGPKPRTSEWLARKNEGEQDLPTELPNDFRDGFINPRRERDIERKKERLKTMPARVKPKAKVRPAGGQGPGLPFQKDTENEASIDDPTANDDDDQSTLLLAQSAAAVLEAQKAAAAEKVRAEAAARETEENLRAKMALFNESDDESPNDFMDNPAADGRATTPDKHIKPTAPAAANARSKHLQTSDPTLSKAQNACKELQIVSAKTNSAQNSTTKTMNTKVAATSILSFRRGKEQDLSDSDSDSDSDSEDEIPAVAPGFMTKKPLGAPVGRPTIVSNVGVPSRGRGRPRGRGRGRGRGRPREG